MASATEVLLADEKRRMRLVAWFTLAVIGVSVAALGFVRAGPAAAWEAVTGAFMGTASVLLLFTLRAGRYTTRVGVAWGLCVAVGLAGGYVAWGPLSLHALFLPLLAFALALNAHRAGGLAVLVVGVGAHGVSTVLMGVGHPLAAGARVRLADGEVPTVLHGLALIDVATVAAFLIGRRMRAKHADDLAELQRAQRAIARQEALLADAKRALVRGGKIGGPGRYTDQVLGTYRIGALLGRGGMGEVYVAEHIAGGSAAAVKVLHSHLLHDPQRLRRFLREAELASAPDTENIVRVFATSAESDLIPYIAMERLEGETLSEFLTSDPERAAAELVPMVAGVAAGLDVAHAASIVHRDIKPQNIFRHVTGGRVVWKLLDFGVATVTAGDVTVTQSKVLGTPAYMAPEQAAGERLTLRCDVYALGAVIYSVLTGHAPFEATDARQTMIALVTGAPVRPSDLADLEEDVESVLAIALARLPEDRFASAGELARALRDAQRGELAAAWRTHAARVLAKRGWARDEIR